MFNCSCQYHYRPEKPSFMKRQHVWTTIQR